MSTPAPAPDLSLDHAADAVPVSWTQGTWFVDPTNVSGAASDQNDCTTANRPCATFVAIANRWGTFSPRLRQNTTVTFLSSQTNVNDPVHLDPYIENGAEISLRGALGAAQTVATGILANVVAKSRAGGRLLQATLPAGAQVGQLVINSKQASRAWVYKSVSGNDWLLSQPILADGTPPGWNPREVDSWANGDAVTLYRPVAVNLVEAAPVVGDCDSPYVCTNDLLIDQVAVADPSGANANPLRISGGIHVSILDSSLQRPVLVSGGAADWYPNFIDLDVVGPLSVSVPVGYVYVFGGQIRASASGTQLIGALLAKDAVVGASVGLGDGMYGAVFVDQGAALSVLPGVDWWWTPSGQADGTSGFWGPGAVAVTGDGRLEYPAGSANVAATFQQTGGLTIDGQTTACSVDTAGTGAWTCGIALTPANLASADLATGFGGSAYVQGGGSIASRP